MSNTQDQFAFTQNVEEPANSFRIVHLHNKSDKYHLMRQVLLDSALTQDTYCFFYHILAMNIDDFNTLYGSFACLISRTDSEADLYLNVEPNALKYIITYIQTGKINEKEIYCNDWRVIDEISDLATMFGMPKLVGNLRNLHPSEEKINDVIATIRHYAYNILSLWKSVVDKDYDINTYMTIIEDFINENKQQIIDTYIKPMHHGSAPLQSKIAFLGISILYIPLLTKFIEDNKKNQQQIYESELQKMFEMARKKEQCNTTSTSNYETDLQKMFEMARRKEQCCATFTPNCAKNTSFMNNCCTKNFCPFMSQCVGQMGNMCVPNIYNTSCPTMSTMCVPIDCNPVHCVFKQPENLGMNCSSFSERNYPSCDNISYSYPQRTPYMYCGATCMPTQNNTSFCSMKESRTNDKVTPLSEKCQMRMSENKSKMDTQPSETLDDILNSLKTRMSENKSKMDIQPTETLDDILNSLKETAKEINIPSICEEKTSSNNTVQYDTRKIKEMILNSLNNCPLFCNKNNEEENQNMTNDSMDFSEEDDFSDTDVSDESACNEAINSPNEILNTLKPMADCMTNVITYLNNNVDLKNLFGNDITKMNDDEIKKIVIDEDKFKNIIENLRKIEETR